MSKVTIVTGGSRGIGAATAKLLAGDILNEVIIITRIRDQIADDGPVDDSNTGLTFEDIAQKIRSHRCRDPTNSRHIL